MAKAVVEEPSTYGLVLSALVAVVAIVSLVLLITNAI